MATADKIGNYFLLGMIVVLWFSVLFMAFHWLPFSISTFMLLVQSYNVYKLYICKS